MQTIDVADLTLEFIGSRVTFPSTVDYPEAKATSTGVLLSVQHEMNESRRGRQSKITIEVLSSPIQFIVQNDNIDVH